MSLNGHQETQTTPSTSLVHQIHIYYLVPFGTYKPNKGTDLNVLNYQKIDYCDYTNQLRLHSSAATALISCDCTHQLRLHSSAATALISCDCTHQLRLHSSAATSLISCDCTHQLRLHSSAATSLISCDFTHQLFVTIISSS